MNIFSKNMLLVNNTEYTLNVVLTPSNATCTLTYGGSSYNATTATVKAGTVISYSIYHSTYGAQTGTVTMNSDKTLTCTGSYTTSQTEMPWTQPTLSANGTMGGVSFAVSASSVYSQYDAYYAFDNNSSTMWSVYSKGSTDLPATMTIYNPDTLRVIKITITNTSGYALAFTSGSVQAKADYMDAWTNVVSSWTNSNTTAGSSWDITVNSVYAYKYWRITFTGFNNSSYRPQCQQITLDAHKVITSYSYYWDITVS